MTHRRALWLSAGAVAIVGLAVAAPAIQNALTPGQPPIAADNLDVRAPLEKALPPRALGSTKVATPMAERVATLGILNKRNGLTRDLSMKPGEAVHIGDVVVRLKACDQTEPWEKEQLTGAFVQVIVKNTVGEKWRKVFSGWLYKESPSLNVVEHPVYDVWVKACTMRHADVGPNTVVLSGDAAGKAPTRSSAKKSGSSAPATEPDPSEDSAPSNEEM
jgi:hypothetical protein